MNDNFFIAVCARVRTPLIKSNLVHPLHPLYAPPEPPRYFLGRLTCAKDRLFMSWKITEIKGIITEDSLSLASARKYSLQTFSNKSTIKDLGKGVAEYFRQNGQKTRNIWASYFQNFLKNKVSEKEINLPNNYKIDFIQEIIGTIKPNDSTLT